MSVSTVARDPATGTVMPRVRICGFRGFFGELKPHPSGEKQLEENGEKNPAIFESDMLSFTTDVRMEKVGQLAEFNGAIEVAFWVKEAMSQWRIRGRAFVIGDDAEEKHEQEARREILKGLRRRKQNVDDEKQWTWEKEVTTYFANHTPFLRGMTCTSTFMFLFPFAVHNTPSLCLDILRLARRSDFHICEGSSHIVVIE